MRLKKGISLFLSLLVFWFFLTINFNVINIIVGIIVSFIVTIFSYSIIYNRSFNLQSFYFSKLVIYLFKLFFHIYKSSISYIVNILSRDCKLIVVEVELQITNPLLISIIANSITLTPGTVTIDYIDNKLIVLALINSQENEKIISERIKNSFEKSLL